MKERFNYELPAEVGGEKRYLPDYVTIGFQANGEEYEVEVHPDRVDDFIKSQEKTHGSITWWQK